MSELYDSIPPAQRKAYEAHAAEVVDEAAAPVMAEIGHLAAMGAQAVVDEATRATMIAGALDSLEKGEPFDAQKFAQDYPNQRYPIQEMKTPLGSGVDKQGAFAAAAKNRANLKYPDDSTQQ